MAEPVILSVGAAFAALGLNDKSSQDVQLFDDVKGWFQNKFASEDAASKDEASKDEAMKDYKEYEEPIYTPEELKEREEIADWMEECYKKEAEAKRKEEEAKKEDSRKKEEASRKK